jgi:hypothetical protein
MSGVSPGPRKYKIFVCHRYGDDRIYGDLRHLLNKAKNFRWKNLSIQTDHSLEIRTERGLKTSISRKVKKADILLVFAHSSGKWIDHELDAAQFYGVPVISVLDPVRVEDPSRRVVRSQRVVLAAKAEVSLNEPALIIRAIRKHSRTQNAKRSAGDLSPADQAVQPTSLAREEENVELAKPADIARRLSAHPRERGFIGRLGMFLFGQRGSAGHKERPH